MKKQHQQKEDRRIKNLEKRVKTLARDQGPKRATSRVTKPSLRAEVTREMARKAGCESAVCRSVCENALRGRSSLYFNGSGQQTIGISAGAPVYPSRMSYKGMSFSSKKTFEVNINASAATAGMYDANGFLVCAPWAFGWSDYDSLNWTNLNSYANAATFLPGSTGCVVGNPVANPPYAMPASGCALQFIPRYYKVIVEDVSTPVMDRAGRLVTYVTHCAPNNVTFDAAQQSPAGRVYDLALLEESERVVVQAPLQARPVTAITGTAALSYTSGVAAYGAPWICIGFWGVEKGTIATITIECEGVYVGQNSVPDSTFMSAAAEWEHAVNSLSLPNAPYFSWTVSEASERGQLVRDMSAKLVVAKEPGYVNAAASEELARNPRGSWWDAILDYGKSVPELASAVASVASIVL